MKQAENQRLLQLRSSLCADLRYLVAAIDVSQKELASVIGIDEANLSRVLNGKLNFGVDTLLKLVDRLGFFLSFSINCPPDLSDMSVDQLDGVFAKYEDKILAEQCVNPLIHFE